MSIKGIRKLRDISPDMKSLYDSQEIPKSVQIRKAKNLELIKFNLSRQLNLNDSMRLNDEILAQTERKLVKRNAAMHKKDYQKFLDHQIKIKDIQFQSKIQKSTKIMDLGFNSNSSKQRRSDRITEKNQSRLSNYIIKQTNNQKIPAISKTSFRIQFVVGKGGFGKVWKVRQKKTSKIYAMKEMSKMKVINKRSVSSVMNEKVLLQKLSHPFLVNMKYAFQDEANLYLVMDYVNGGDLRYHFCNRKKFSEIQTKFFVGCILLGLQYLHNNNVIHRDLKPQNLVMDEKGYVKITDLGVSKQWRTNNGSDTSGTPGYMSPEVICKGDHSYTSDFFALGVIVYQFMIGKRPYLGRNRQQIREQILAKQVKIEQVPSGWSPQSIDFVNKLIQRKPHNRLGNNGLSYVKNHPWLKGFDWENLQKRSLKAPFIPLTIQQDYSNYQQCISSDTIIEDQEQYNLLLKSKETQELFQGYEYNLYNQLKKVNRKSLNIQDMETIQKTQEKGDRLEKRFKRLIAVK